MKFVKNLQIATLVMTSALMSMPAFADDECPSPPNASGCLHEGLAKAEREVGDGKYKWGFVNAQGKVVIPPKYDNVGDFKNGIAPAYLNEKVGFINKSGKTVIPFRYDVVGIPSEGLIAFSQHGKT